MTSWLNATLEPHPFLFVKGQKQDLHHIYIIRIYEENVLLKKKEENVVYVLFVHKNTATKMLNKGNHKSLRKLANMTITTIAWRFRNFFIFFMLSCLMNKLKLYCDPEKIYETEKEKEKEKGVRIKTH